MTMVGGGRPLIPEILGQIYLKSPTGKHRRFDESSTY